MRGKSKNRVDKGKGQNDADGASPETTRASLRKAHECLDGLLDRALSTDTSETASEVTENAFPVELAAWDSEVRSLIFHRDRVWLAHRFFVGEMHGAVSEDSLTAYPSWFRACLKLAPACRSLRHCSTGPFRKALDRLWKKARKLLLAQHPNELLIEDEKSEDFLIVWRMAQIVHLLNLTGAGVTAQRLSGELLSEITKRWGGQEIAIDGEQLLAWLSPEVEAESLQPIPLEELPHSSNEQGSHHELLAGYRDGKGSLLLPPALLSSGNCSALDTATNQLTSQIRKLVESLGETSLVDAWRMKAYNLIAVSNAVQIDWRTTATLDNAGAEAVSDRFVAAVYEFVCSLDDLLAIRPKIPLPLTTAFRDFTKALGKRGLRFAPSSLRPPIDELSEKEMEIKYTYHANEKRPRCQIVSRVLLREGADCLGDTASIVVNEPEGSKIVSLVGRILDSDDVEERWSDDILAKWEALKATEKKPNSSAVLAWHACVLMHKVSSCRGAEPFPDTRIEREWSELIACHYDSIEVLDEDKGRELDGGLDVTEDWHESMLANVLELKYRGYRWMNPSVHFDPEVLPASVVRSLGQKSPLYAGLLTYKCALADAAKELNFAGPHDILVQHLCNVVSCLEELKKNPSKRFRFLTNLVTDFAELEEQMGVPPSEQKQPTSIEWWSKRWEKLNVLKKSLQQVAEPAGLLAFPDIGDWALNGQRGNDHSNARSDLPYTVAWVEQTADTISEEGEISRVLKSGWMDANKEEEFSIQPVVVVKSLRGDHGKLAVRNVLELCDVPQRLLNDARDLLNRWRSPSMGSLAPFVEFLLDDKSCSSPDRILETFCKAGEQRQNKWVPCPVGIANTGELTFGVFDRTTMNKADEVFYDETGRFPRESIASVREIGWADKRAVVVVSRGPKSSGHRLLESMHKNLLSIPEAASLAEDIKVRVDEVVQDDIVEEQQAQSQEWLEVFLDIFSVVSKVLIERLLDGQNDVEFANLYQEWVETAGQMWPSMTTFGPWKDVDLRGGLRPTDIEQRVVYRTDRGMKYGLFVQRESAEHEPRLVEELWLPGVCVSSPDGGGEEVRLPCVQVYLASSSSELRLGEKIAAMPLDDVSRQELGALVDKFRNTHFERRDSRAFLIELLNYLDKDAARQKKTANEISKVLDLLRDQYGIADISDAEVGKPAPRKLLTANYCDTQEKQSREGAATGELIHMMRRTLLDTASNSVLQKARLVIAE